MSEPLHIEKITGQTSVTVIHSLNSDNLEYAAYNQSGIQVYSTVVVARPDPADPKNRAVFEFSAPFTGRVAISRTSFVSLNSPPVQVAANPISSVDASTNFQPLTSKGQANGYPSLDAGGKIPASQLPATGIPQVYVVADYTARASLTPVEGDESIVLTDSTSWVYDGSTWQSRLPLRYSASNSGEMTTEGNFATYLTLPAPIQSGTYDITLSFSWSASHDDAAIEAYLLNDWGVVLSQIQSPAERDDLVAVTIEDSIVVYNGSADWGLRLKFRSQKRNKHVAMYRAFLRLVRTPDA